MKADEDIIVSIHHSRRSGSSSHVLVITERALYEFAHSLDGSGPSVCNEKMSDFKRISRYLKDECFDLRLSVTARDIESVHLQQRSEFDPTLTIRYNDRSFLGRRVSKEVIFNFRKEHVAGVLDALRQLAGALLTHD